MAERTPKNSLANLRPVVKAGTLLYGVAIRNSGARIQVLEDQLEEIGKLKGNTVVGLIRILTLGLAVNNYHSLERYVKTSEPIDVEFCNSLIHNQPDYIEKVSHHLFRYNGWALEKNLSANEKESARENERMDNSRLDKRQAKAEAGVNGELLLTPEKLLDLIPPEIIHNGEDATRILMNVESTMGDPIDIYESTEAKRILVSHYKLERDARLVRIAKANYLNKEGNEKAPCQACREESYTIYGVNVLEAHHQHPLGERDGSSITTVDDFDLLCPSCHRALHRMGRGATLAKMREQLNARGTKLWIGNKYL